jgi:hypothetical protein
MQLAGIHLLLTYRCTWTCDHCFLFGDPDQEGTMTYAQIADMIEQSAASGVTMVYFEGGEPTLAYPVLLKAAALARERGLDWGVVTNCHFAESAEDAAIWFAPFKELGIADLSLSTYPYYLQEADDRLLRNALVAARELGLPMGVLEVGAPADLRDLGVACMDPAEVMCKGRAGVELAGERARRAPQTLTTCPYEDFAAPERAHVGCDGELQLCQGISAGNVWRAGDAAAVSAAGHGSGLAALMAAYRPQEIPIVREILHGGPWELAQAFDVSPARALYADECHLCWETRSRLRDRFPDVLTPAPAYGDAGSQ